MHTAVDDGFLHRQQSFLAAHHQFAQRKNKVSFQGKRVIFLGVVGIDVHGIDELGTVGRNFDDLTLQTIHQRRVFAFGVVDDNIIVRHQKGVCDFPLCRETFAASRSAEDQTVRVLQLLPVHHDQVVGQGIQPVVQALFAGLVKFLRGKRNENCRAAGGQPSLNFDLTVCQRQAAHQPLLLLEIQSAQVAVVLLCNAGCLKNVVFQFLFRAPGVQHQKGDKEHPLVLALQFLQKSLGISAVGRQIRRNDVNIISGTDCLLLFLDLAAIQFRDGALDGLDGTVLIDTLNVHGDDLGRIHIQKILQKLVADVGGRDAQKAGGAIDAAHLEGTAVLESKGGGRNGILHGQPAFHKVFPVKVKLGCAVHVEHIVHEFQPLGTIQGFCLHTQPVEVVQQIVLDVVEPGLDLCHAFALHPKGDEFGLGQTIIALGKLLAQHLGILGTNIVKAVLLERNADAFLKLGAVGCHVHKGQFKFDGAVEKVEEGTPFLENGGLVLLLGELVIDVLILDGAGVVAGTDTAGAVLKHPLHGDLLHLLPLFLLSVLLGGKEII